VIVVFQCIIKNKTKHINLLTKNTSLETNTAIKKNIYETNNLLTNLHQLQQQTLQKEAEEENA
jgi:cellobiose-specific phosphotransferase system component IIA